jgi:hypothetical protein
LPPLVLKPVNQSFCKCFARLGHLLEGVREDAFVAIERIPAGALPQTLAGELEQSEAF